MLPYPAGMFARVRPDTWGHLAIAAALLVGVLVVGTVGYSEIADGDPGTAWKVFTSVLIVLGTGSMLYGATSVIESIVEGRLTGQFRRYRMQRTIDSMDGHLIVCGTGRVGQAITGFVRSIGQEVVVVDRDPGRFSDQDVLHVLGAATSDERLRHWRCCDNIYHRGG